MCLVGLKGNLWQHPEVCNWTVDYKFDNRRAYHRVPSGNSHITTLHPDLCNAYTGASDTPGGHSRPMAAALQGADRYKCWATTVASTEVWDGADKCVQRWDRVDNGSMTLAGGNTGAEDTGRPTSVWGWPRSCRGWNAEMGAIRTQNALQLFDKVRSSAESDTTVPPTGQL